mmetsp:Transcript_7988/g.11792  ORF Transcript_7988/g.11792 Transcript_7988/m.11792 type:complete len:510 (-) Transcript_7988:595-2124(-)|eukprot:CAMPEP_0202439136 /NCGR_PEP_ID=MMETSP1345-20130828/36006_1 /ASSEMBLY_ACC=CAM_ASM_000843 /TAXON_ID=342563 /ORGANISM="Fabrea Fabrea salina" /LENGTH=509 /DNA_ID=CAMNT_0049053653 /DNA_START=370 /DNA_END=1899 /DNA_ORIENTATION=-
MVSVEKGLAEIIESAPSGQVYWLVGTDVNHVLNILSCKPVEEIKPVLPGGVEIIGQLITSEGVTDFLNLAKTLKLDPAVFIAKSNGKYIAYETRGPLLSQKDLTISHLEDYIVCYSSSEVPVFSLSEPQILLEDSVLFELDNQVLSTSAQTSWSSFKVKKGEVVYLEILYNLSTETEGFAPVLEIEPETRAYNLTLNWSSFFSTQTPIEIALQVHFSKLKEIMSAMVAQLKEQPEKNCASYCFFNNHCAHPFNAIYTYKSFDEEAEELLQQRQEMHKMLRLPEDWPLVRSTCNIKKREGLRNVHQPLLSITSKDVGVKYAIGGSYSYFHYGQEGFDDKGWGCAYRSLQTIVSWLNEQNYSDKEVPSHYQIQKMLVEAGDKTKDFLGSKEWIGAFEVMLILDVYYGITSKILNVSSGSELQSKGRELSQHFTEEQTPVMIGGGVLAYTLLGVDYNEDTGDIRFLILDPHYTGTDNPKTIRDKGWCAWKGPEIFKADAFYNLCMPQRPKYI